MEGACEWVGQGVVWIHTESCRGALCRSAATQSRLRPQQASDQFVYAEFCDVLRGSSSMRVRANKR